MCLLRDTLDKSDWKSAPLHSLKEWADTCCGRDKVDGTIETLEMGTVTITATTTDGSNLTLNYVINVTESQSQPAGNSLDVNGDGAVTSADITVIYNYILGN